MLGLLHFHQSAGLGRFGAVQHDEFAGLQAFLDDTPVADQLAQRDRAVFDLLVGSHDGYLVAVEQREDGFLGNQDDAFGHALTAADAGELAGLEVLFGVGAIATPRSSEKNLP